MMSMSTFRPKVRTRLRFPVFNCPASVSLGPPLLGLSALDWQGWKSTWPIHLEVPTRCAFWGAPPLTAVVRIELPRPVCQLRPVWPLSSDLPHQRDVSVRLPRSSCSLDVDLFIYFSHHSRETQDCWAWKSQENSNCGNTHISSDLSDQLWPLTWSSPSLAAWCIQRSECRLYIAPLPPDWMTGWFHEKADVEVCLMQCSVSGDYAHPCHQKHIILLVCLSF